MFEIGLPVLAAGLLILASHIPLGHKVLKQGIVFIDLAIAQLAALGTVLASQWAENDGNHWLTQAMAVLFALSGVALVSWIKNNLPQWREAFIGLIYVMSASVLVLLVAGQPHGGQLLTSTLSADILWLDWQDLFFLAGAAVTVQLLALVWPNHLERFFYPIFAITITISVVNAGIYLVFVCLIAPALASIVYQQRKLWSYLVGIAGFIVGLLTAWNLDLPAAACIVVCIVTALIIALCLQHLYARPVDQNGDQVNN